MIGKAGKHILTGEQTLTQHQNCLPSHCCFTLASITLSLCLYACSSASGGWRGTFLGLLLLGFWLWIKWTVNGGLYRVRTLLKQWPFGCVTGRVFWVVGLKDSKGIYYHIIFCFILYKRNSCTTLSQFLCKLIQTYKLHSLHFLEDIFSTTLGDAFSFCVTEFPQLLHLLHHYLEIATNSCWGKWILFCNGRPASFVLHIKTSVFRDKSCPVADRTAQQKQRLHRTNLNVDGVIVLFT